MIFSAGRLAHVADAGLVADADARARARLSPTCPRSLSARCAFATQW